MMRNIMGIKIIWQLYISMYRLKNIILHNLPRRLVKVWTKVTAEIANNKADEAVLACYV